MLLRSIEMLDEKFDFVLRECTSYFLRRFENARLGVGVHNQLQAELIPVFEFKKNARAVVHFLTVRLVPRACAKVRLLLLPCDELFNAD